MADAAGLSGGLGLPLWQGARERQETRRELDRIKALSLPEARTMALKLLGDPELFHMVSNRQTRRPTPSQPRGI